MDARGRSNCYCGHAARDHDGTTYDDYGFCHAQGCECVSYDPDPFDLGP